MAAPTDLEQLSHNRGQLRPAPAASIWRIDVALGRPVDINSAYRDWDEQQEKRDAYLHFLRYGSPWAPLALEPEDSWHCKGMAVDTDDNPRNNPQWAQVWADNGWRFEVQSEPWHGQYYTSLDKNYGKPAGGGAVPLPTPDPDDPAPTPDTPEEEEDDMAKNSGFKYTRSSDNKPICLLINPASRWWFEFQDVPAVVPTGVSGIAATMDTGTWPTVSEAWASGMKQSLDRG